MCSLTLREILPGEKGPERLQCIMSDQVNRDHESFIVYQKDRHGLPLNAELEGNSLVSSFITPTSGIFHRNHDDYLLIPRGVKAVEEDWSVTLSVDEELVRQNPDHWRSWAKNASPSNTIQLAYKHILRSTGKCCGLEYAEVLACMECAGNRRSEISKSGDEKAEGIQWNSGAISNAVWKGPLLRSLLLLQGIPDPYGHYDRSTLQALVPSKEAIENDCTSWAQHLHLHLQSAQPTSESDKPCGDFFGASIPLSVALHPSQQSIIATHLNGCILPQQHGYPLRIVLPGHVGARWVKWLSALRISPNANDSPPMRLDYKIIERPQNVSVEEEKRWKAKISGQEMDTEFRKEVLSRIAPIQTLGVGSSIEVPTEGTTFPLETKTIKVKGYATGQYGSPISKYEVIILRQNEPFETHDSLRRRAVTKPKADWIPASVRSEINNEVSGQDERETQIVFSYAWSLWETELPISINFQEGCFALLGRATTASGVLQEPETPWNLRGFCIRSWPVVSGLSLS